MPLTGLEQGAAGTEREGHPARRHPDPAAHPGSALRLRRPPPNLPGRPVRQSRALRMGVCAALAVLFTLVILRYSFRHGRLLLFPTFDDVGYFSEGVERLQILYDEGFRGLLGNYRHVAPHSPYSVYLAMLAFMVFGIHDWAPYAANALLLFG